MRSPFPGMDPYIEARGLWGDFHDRLIGELDRAITSCLPDRYVTRFAERNYIEVLDPVTLEPRMKRIIPDYTVQFAEGATRTTPPSPAASTAVVEPEAVPMHGVIESEEREIFLEIRELDPDRRLVTCLEILSPTNKSFGSVGWSLYQRKRQLFLQGYAHLVEIDLLRGGQRMPMAEPWPERPYSILIIRKEEAPRCLVWPADLDRPLPKLSIPLASPDPDLNIGLQPLVDAIYARSRYARDIDYTAPLKTPLSAAQAEWLKQRLADVDRG